MPEDIQEVKRVQDTETGTLYDVTLVEESRTEVTSYMQAEELVLAELQAAGVENAEDVCGSIMTAIDGDNLLS